MKLTDKIHLYHEWVKAKKEGKTREEFSKETGKSSEALKTIFLRMKKDLNSQYSLEEIVELISACSGQTGFLPQELKRSEIKNWFEDNDDFNLWENDVKKFGGLNKIIQLHFPTIVTNSSLTKYKIQKQVKKINKSNKNNLEMELLRESVEEWTEKVFKGTVISNNASPVKKLKTYRVLTLVLSDLHFGSDLLQEETGVLDYKTTEEARRLAKIVKETVDYKRQHRDETSLNVLLLGDLIQNQLHDARDGAELAEQVCRAIYLLTQAVHKLSFEFGSVTVYANAGNHGRYTNRHHDRATYQKWDSHETVIAFAIKQACANLKNVTFVIIKNFYL